MQDYFMPGNCPAFLSHLYFSIETYSPNYIYSTSIHFRIIQKTYHMLSPSPTNVPGYFQLYINQVEETELFSALNNQTSGISLFLNSISEEKSTYAYAAGKWTIKELLQHIIDTERIFCYRALCIARGEKTALPAFNENEYAGNSYANERSWEGLVNEFLLVRESSLILFSSFRNHVLEVFGTAGSNSLSVSNIGFILVGHFNHHKKVLVEKYL